jgi:segregation and condensation protein B
MNIFLKGNIDNPQSTASIPSVIDQERMIEAILFASREPLSLNEISNRMPDNTNLKDIIIVLQEKYRNRGFKLVKILDGYAFRTATDLSYLLQKHVVEKRKLSKAALEVLAIIAYHKSSTRAEIEEIRGVSVSTGTLDLLMDMGWIGLGPRRATPGRPITFLVTKDFLDHFGLESTKDLPGINELRETGLLDRSSASIGVGVAQDLRDETAN